MTKPSKKRKPSMPEAYVERAYKNLHDEGGLASLTAFAKSRKNHWDLKSLEKSLSSIEAFSRHRRTRRNYPLPAIILHKPHYNYCADLIDMSSLAWHNRNHKWILLVLDSFSKYISLQALKTKSGEDTAEALKKSLKDMSRGGRKYPTQLFSDSGREFLNSKVKALLLKHHVYQYTSKTPRKASICENAVKKVKTLIWKYFTLQSTKTWIDILPLIAQKINNTPHSSHKFKPVDINEKTADEAFGNMYSHLASTPPRPPKYKIGDLVRIANTRVLFTKYYLPQFSKQIFRIGEVKNTFPVPSYKLETLLGEEVASSFVDEELSLAIVK